MTDIFELLKGKGSEKQPVIVQGITGKFGTRHTNLMIEYGTNIVAGVTPGTVSYTHLTLPTKRIV